MIDTSLGNVTHTVPPASISFLFCGRTLTTTRTALLALSPPPPPPPKAPAAALLLGVCRLVVLSALESADPSVGVEGERGLGVRTLPGKGGVVMLALMGARVVLTIRPVEVHLLLLADGDSTMTWGFPWKGGVAHAEGGLRWRRRYVSPFGWAQSEISLEKEHAQTRGRWSHHSGRSLPLSPCLLI